MNFPTIDFGWLGNGNLIGMMAVLHVMINHAVAIGGCVLMVSIEYTAYKQNNAALEAYARWLSKWILIITTTFGAMTGVGIWFTTTVILPDAIGSLLRIFHWAWFTEWLVFVSEVVLLLTYFYTWDKWSGVNKKRHIQTGMALCIMSWLTLVIITGILAAQINPGNWVETLSFLDAFFNPTWVPSMIFRTFAAIALGVAVLHVLIRWKLKDMRDRIVGIAVVRDPANEADRALERVAFAATDHGAPGPRAAEIVNPKIERRLRLEPAALDPDRKAGRHVHQRDDRPRGEHARRRIADEVLPIREPHLDPIVAVCVIGNAYASAVAAELHLRDIGNRELADVRHVADDPSPWYLSSRKRPRVASVSRSPCASCST